MKRIRIDKRDVYRAKHESITDGESIFYESYKKAATVLNEIISDSQDICKGFCFGKNRMTNNIILFNGERGYGKTTAMQSFSDFLEKSEKDVESSFYFDVDFLCIDTIDPSCMNGEESIVRVVLTYLFSLVMPKLKGVKADKPLDNRLKVEILENFQKCYEFIDYLNGSRKDRDFMPDDIEYISKLGNSHELKKEIWKLLQNVMQLITREDGSKYSNPEKLFLVLKIDDADLSTSSTFKLCDEIRSYFSLPNLVVLMAGNLIHFKDNILEEYISKPRLVHDDYILYIYDNYNHMAKKYVEKMFPQGHVIRLPQIDELLLNHSTGLILEYTGESKEEMRGAVNEDIQDQLLRMLFEKTGILLVRPKNKLHAFLPHTMRELTHFVKMIYEMEEIDYYCIFNVYIGKRGTLDVFTREELEKARGNLNALNQYFLDYWCSDKLEDAEAKQIREMNSLGQKDSKYQLMFEEDGNNSKSIAEYIYSAKVQRENPKIAYAIFYSIHNFLQLYDALADSDLMKAFIDFSCDEFDFLKEFNRNEEETWNGYQILRYGVSYDLLSESLDSTVTAMYSDAVFYNIFCDTQKTGEELFEIQNNRIEIIDKTKVLKFDLVNSLKKLLYSFLLYQNKNGDLGDKNDKVQDELGVISSGRLMESEHGFSEVGQIKLRKLDEELVSSGDLYFLSLYMCNVELQKYVSGQICNSVRKVNHDSHLVQIYEEVFNSFDKAFASLKYISRVSSFGQKLAEFFGEHRQALYNLFFSDRGNLKKILRECVEIIDKNVDEIKEITSAEHILELTESKFDSFTEQLKWEPSIMKFIILNEDMNYNYALSEILLVRKEILAIVEKIRKDCIFETKVKELGVSCGVHSEVADDIKENVEKYHTELDKLMKKGNSLVSDLRKKMIVR